MQNGATYSRVSVPSESVPLQMESASTSRHLAGVTAGCDPMSILSSHISRRMSHFICARFRRFPTEEPLYGWFPSFTTDPAPMYGRSAHINITPPKTGITFGMSFHLHFFRGRSITAIDHTWISRMPCLAYISITKASWCNTKQGANLDTLARTCDGEQEAQNSPLLNTRCFHKTWKASEKATGLL